MSGEVITEEHEIGSTSEAAVLCAITVTRVEMWEEKRVKTSACPFFHSYTHINSFLLLPHPRCLTHTSIKAAGLDKETDLQYSTDSKHTWVGLKARARCVWQRNALPASLRALAASCQPFPTDRGALWLLFDLVCFGLLIKHGLCVVGGASQSGAFSSPHPPTSIHPLHRCAGCTEPLQSQQSFTRDSHPTGGTITRGLQNRWEKLNPNKMTIHIFFSSLFDSSKQGHVHLLIPV